MNIFWCVHRSTRKSMPLLTSTRVRKRKRKIIWSLLMALIAQRHVNEWVPDSSRDHRGRDQSSRTHSSKNQRTRGQSNGVQSGAGWSNIGQRGRALSGRNQGGRDQEPSRSAGNDPRGREKAACKMPLTRSRQAGEHRDQSLHRRNTCRCDEYPGLQCQRQGLDRYKKTETREPPSKIPLEKTPPGRCCLKWCRWGKRAYRMEEAAVTTEDSGKGSDAVGEHRGLKNSTRGMPQKAAAEINQYKKRVSRVYYFC